MDESYAPERQKDNNDASPENCPRRNAHLEEDGVTQAPMRLQSADDLQRSFCRYMITCLEGSNSNHEQSTAAFQQVVLLPHMTLTKPDRNEPSENITSCERPTGADAHDQRCVSLYNRVGEAQRSHEDSSPHPRPSHILLAVAVRREEYQFGDRLRATVDAKRRSKSSCRRKCDVQAKDRKSVV